LTTPRNVDALVVNWQTAHLLDGCLRSLIAQRGVRVRLVVVDNGSSDGSTDLVAERFPDACLIRLPENVGYTRATNAGLRHCTASYVLLCNPDCTPDPDAVAILADRLERTVDAAAAAPKMIGTEGEPQGFVFRFPTLWDAVFCYTETGQHLDRRTGRHMVRRYDRGDLLNTEDAQPVEHPGAACLLLRRDVLGDGLDEGFPLFFSDTELCWRLREVGLEVWLEPTARAYHGKSASVARVSWTVILHELQRGLRRFYRLHHGRSRQATLDVILVADIVIRSAVHGARRRSLAAARADLGLLRRLLADLPAPQAPWREER